MPKFDATLLNEDLPKTDKVTVNAIIKTENKEANTLNIYDLVKKEKKSTKEQIGITLRKEKVDKLKTLVIDLETDMSKLFEELLEPLLSNIAIKEENVKAYNDKNKAKGRRTKKITKK